MDLIGVINKKKEKNILFMLLALFVTGMLFASASTSPLYPQHYGGDSAIFLLIGKGIVNGKMPYVELFDHKGPILFFAEALGYGIGGRVGVFLLQCIAGCINLVFMYKIWSLVREKQETRRTLDVLLAFGATYTIFFYTFEMGNLTEEYSLPLISMCLYLVVKYAKKVEEKQEHPYRYSFCYGVCIGVLAFVRVNNAVAICAGVLAIALYLLYKKQYKNLFLNIMTGIMGFAVVAIPIIVYFAMQSALYDMIYATFLHNFKYVGGSSQREIWKYPLIYLALYLPIITSIVCIVRERLKKERKMEFIDLTILCIVFLNLLCQIVSNSYPHYFAIYVPVFVLVLARYGKKTGLNLQTLLIVVCVIVNGFFAAKYTLGVVKNSFFTDKYERMEQHIENIVAVIPEEERDSVIGYNIYARYYMYADIIPCYKYYTFQKWWSESNPSIDKDFMKWLEEDKPLWVITNANESDKQLNGILEEVYELKNESKHLKVYRLNEQ